MQIEEKVCEHSTNNDKTARNEKATFPSSQLKAIDDIVKKEGYSKHEVYKKMISTDGGNYLGDLYEVDIKGETANGYKETNVFVKTIIANDNNKIFSVGDAFFKESFTYKEISKIFTELQNDAKVPEDERFNMAKSYDATNIEAMFLENLGKKGFFTLHRMDVMPLKFAELAVQQLAKFHGLFYAIQRKRPEYFNDNLKSWKQLFIYSDDWRDFIQNLCKLTSKALSNETKPKVDKFIQKVCNKFILYAEDKSSPGCTICHGDYRVNNILVRESNGQLSKAVPVDFQLLYYGCPVNDFIYLIFNASDQEFRKNHLTDLKNLYYENLDKFLVYLDLDANEIYPRKEFERQFVEKLDLGLIYALYCIPFHFTKDDHVPDIGKDDVKNLGFVLDSRYEERIQGIVDDFIQWGYL